MSPSSTNVADFMPNFSNLPLTSFVLIFFNSSLSTIFNLPSFSLEDSKILMACFFSFEGIFLLWDLTLGPWTTPPPLNWTTFFEPCLALPVPFCLYILALDPTTSFLSLTLWLPCLPSKLPVYNFSNNFLFNFSRKNIAW